MTVFNEKFFVSTAKSWGLQTAKASAMPLAMFEAARKLVLPQANPRVPLKISHLILVLLSK